MWDRPLLLRWEYLPWIIWWAHPFYAQWFLHSVMTSFLHFSSFQWKPISIRAQFSNLVIDRPFKRIFPSYEIKAIWHPSSNQHRHFRKKGSSLRWQIHLLLDAKLLLHLYPARQAFWLFEKNKHCVSCTELKIQIMQNYPTNAYISQKPRKLKPCIAGTRCAFKFWKGYW